MSDIVDIRDLEEQDMTDEQWLENFKNGLDTDLKQSHLAIEEIYKNPHDYPSIAKTFLDFERTNLIICLKKRQADLVMEVVRRNL